MIFRWFIMMGFLIMALGCRDISGNKSIPEEQDPWNRANAILDSIIVPSFPAREFNILEYGAVADGSSDILPVLETVLRQCQQEGGGRVLIPAGNYFVKGPIHLLSGVELHLEEGAMVAFSTDPVDYLPVVFTRWEGVECYNYSPLIYAFEQQNIALTGKGVLDGQAGNNNWWPWSGKNTYGWEEGMPSQGDAASRPRLFDWNTQEVPVEQRILGASAYLRPNFVQTYRCKNVLIDGVTIKNSPMWVMHPVLCENVTIQNVSVISHGPNSDGCDPESSRNVLIRNCYFDTGDDCIALKSGRNQDGRRIGRPVENILIRECQMKDGHGGVVIGSEVSGGARQIYAEACTMDSPNLDRALRIKTNKVRGGVIEQLHFRNIQVGEVREAILRINMNYPIYSDTNQTYIPVVQQVYVSDVQSQKSKYGLFIDGYDENHPVDGVFIKNCRFDGVDAGNQIRHVVNLTLDSVYINGALLP